MPRKGSRRPWIFLEGSDSRGLVLLVGSYIEAQRVRALTDTTVKKWEWTLWRFVEWCHERGITRPEEVTRPILERYALRAALQIQALHSPATPPRPAKPEHTA